MKISWTPSAAATFLAPSWKPRGLTRMPPLAPVSMMRYASAATPLLVLLRRGVATAPDDHESFAVDLHALAVDLPVGRGAGTVDRRVAYLPLAQGQARGSRQSDRGCRRQPLRRSPRSSLHPPVRNQARG